MKRRIAKHRKEEPTTQATPDQVRRHHLTDRPTPRNPGHEEAHKRGVGDPPGPVEDRPGLRKAGLTHRVGVQAHPDEIGDEQAETIGEGVENEHRWPGDQDKGTESEPEVDVGLGKPFDALLHSQVDRRAKDGSPHHDHERVESKGPFDADQRADGLRQDRGSESE